MNFRKWNPKIDLNRIFKIMGVALPLAGGLIWWALGQPSSEQVAYWWHRLNVPKASGRQFTVLIADLLDDDGNHKHRDLVVSALLKERGIATHKVLRTLQSETGGDEVENEVRRRARGLRWLDKFNGDVLIWGRVLDEKKTLQLHFLGRSQRYPSADDRRFSLD